jgi:hypothetical protein
MRLSKIESDYILQTPKVPVTNRSCVEIYNEDEGVSIRPIVRLEPEYPIVRNPRSETIHERFSKIDLPIESLDAENLLYPCEDYDGDLSVTVSPGTENESRESYLDWEGFVDSVRPRELKEVFSNILDNEIRVYENELYSDALEHHNGLEKDSFSDWLSEKPTFIYEELVRKSRPGGSSEFEPNGAFYDQINNLETNHNVEGGRLMKGYRQIGVVENQIDDIGYGLKSVDGVIVPEENDTVESFLEDFRR